MRAVSRSIAGLLMLLMLLVAPAFAGEAEDRAAIDRLFVELHDAPDAATAADLSQRIWSYWLNPADPVLAGRMRDVLSARGMGDVTGAIRLLNDLVRDFPDYAEGWNQRATMYYAIGDYASSIADCARVLELEPRHFGALSGRALMELALGQRALALKDISAALAVHPFLEERKLFPELNQPMTRV
jgi:tetratricopeptide (TPR) repeat protein